MERTTEEEIRDSELLITVDDYKHEFESLKEISDVVNKSELKSTIKLLSSALYEKYQYILDASEPYRKKMSFWAKWKAKRERKALYKAELKKMKVADKLAKAEKPVSKPAKGSSKQPDCLVNKPQTDCLVTSQDVKLLRKESTLLLQNAQENSQN